MDRTERQKLGIKKWAEKGFRGSLMWCTGVGKTFGAIMAIKGFLKNNKDKVIKVIVPTEHLKVQWMTELNKHKLIYDVSVEIINTAITLNFQIDFLILDEVHRYASNQFYQIFNQRSPKIVLGLSATFSRLDQRHELLNKYCPVVDEISVFEAVTNKWLSPYKEYKVLLEVDDLQDYLDANAAFIEAFSFFNFDFNLAMKAMTNVIFRRAYAKKMGYEGIDGIVFSWGNALRKRKSFIMDHPKKIEITRRILDARPNAKAITFSATIKQAEKIGRGFTVHSGKTKKKNRLTVNEFSNLEYGVMNTAKSLDEGADIPGLNLAIILCNTSSGTQKTQRVG